MSSSFYRHFALLGLFACPPPARLCLAMAGGSLSLRRGGRGFVVLLVFVEFVEFIEFVGFTASKIFAKPCSHAVGTWSSRVLGKREISITLALQYSNKFALLHHECVLIESSYTAYCLLLTAYYICSPSLNPTSRALTFTPLNRSATFSMVDEIRACLFTILVIATDAPSITILVACLLSN